MMLCYNKIYTEALSEVLYYALSIVYAFSKIYNDVD